MPVGHYHRQQRRKTEIFGRTFSLLIYSPSWRFIFILPYCCWIQNRNRIIQNQKWLKSKNQEDNSERKGKIGA